MGEGGVGVEFVRGVEGEVLVGEDFLGGYVGVEVVVVEDGDVLEGEGEVDEFSDVVVELFGVGVDGCFLFEQSCFGKMCWVVRF